MLKILNIFKNIGVTYHTLTFSGLLEREALIDGKLLPSMHTNVILIWVMLFLY